MSQAHTFVAIYAGDTISSAKIVAASSDPDLVTQVAAALLKDKRSSIGAAKPDPVRGAMNSGRRQALEIIAGGMAE